MYDFFKEMEKFRKEMDEAFKNFLEVPAVKPLLTKGKEFLEFRSPYSDIKESKGEITAKIEIPGVKRSDIKLNVTENALEIKAERKEESEIKKKNFFQQERAYKGFYRLLPLPAPVDPNEVTAKYSNGVLEIRMPKLKIEHKKTKKLIHVK